MSLNAPTRILLVGSGGREHALAWKLAAEPGVNEISVAPGRAAFAAEPRVRCLAGVDPTDPGAVVEAARRTAAELILIGPEAPLAAGVADAARAAGFAVFGPSRAAARIEASKAFCREVAVEAGVPMARGRAFDHLDGAVAYARELARDGGVVVKADGLAAGKGVVVCDDAAGAAAAIEALFRLDVISDLEEESGGARPRVVVEERLTGREASVIALCDGRTAVALPPARDHKRLLDGDDGPNTGGMGAYAPLEDLPDDAADAILHAFHRPILAELARRGRPFVGALYAGLILTDRGPVLLECNARFGDPETQVIVPRLGAALGTLLLACARGELGAAIRRLGLGEGETVSALPVAAAGIVLAAAGYPSGPRRGDPIAGLDAAAEDGALVFHAGTAASDDGGYLTDGGRVLTVVGRGRDVAEAAARANRAADRIAFDGSQRRHDIGLVAAGVAS